MEGLKPQQGGSSTGGSASQRPKSPAKEKKGPYCKRCRSAGHLQRDCPRQKADQELQANVSYIMAQMASMGWQPPEDPTAGAAYPDSTSPNEAYEDDGDGWPDPSAPSEVHLAGPCAMSLPAAASPSRVWMVDSGASVHLISDLTMLHHPRMHSIPKPLHLATSDAVGGIIASGSLCLADARGRKLWLHNVQCAPAANMNLISVSAAIRDGCRFGTDPASAHIKVTGPHAWSSPVLLKR